MPYTPPANDPFTLPRKTPSLSWKNLPPGSTFKLLVLEPAKLLQSTVFNTDKLEFWDEEKTQPKMNAVLNVTVLDGPHSVGEDRSVWAQRPSNIFAAIAQAQADAGEQITTGGILYLRFIGEKPHDNPKLNNIKQYEAKYEPPKPDAFSQPQPQAPQSWGSATPPQPTPTRSW